MHWKPPFVVAASVYRAFFYCFWLASRTTTSLRHTHSLNLGLEPRGCRVFDVEERLCCGTAFVVLTFEMVEFHHVVQRFYDRLSRGLLQKCARNCFLRVLAACYVIESFQHVDSELREDVWGRSKEYLNIGILRTTSYQSVFNMMSHQSDLFNTFQNAWKYLLEFTISYNSLNTFSKDTIIVSCSKTKM